MEKRGGLLKVQAAFWITLILASGLFALLYLTAHGNSGEPYTDVPGGEFVIQMYDGNISAEVRLFYILMVGGGALVLLYSLLTKRANVGWQGRTRVLCDGAVERRDFFVCAVSVIAATQYLIYQQVCPPILVAAVLAVLLFCIDPELALPGLGLYFMAYYGFFAIYRLYALCGGETTINSMELTAVSMSAAVLPLACKKKRKAFVRAMIAVQFIIPALFLVYLQFKYYYNGEIVTIKVTNMVVFIVAALIAVCLAEAAVSARRNWTCADSVSNVICVGTCVSIMAFNRSLGTGAIVVGDLHHVFEDIIGYSQVFELGQTPFQEYIPVSGMYSILQGAIFKLFGNGQYSQYAISTDIFYILIVTALVILLCKNVNRIYVFVFSLFIQVGSYSRIAFILPIVLLLSNRKLIEKKNRWLKVWFLSSLLHGLYYPLYGVATCLAFAPLGIWQIVTYIRSGQLKKDMKKASFWVLWALCLLPAILSAPMLLGLFRHMLAMPGQSRYTEGITRFGQTIDGGFMPYLSNWNTLRMAIYYASTFVIPVLYVWLSVNLAVRCGGISIENKKLKVTNLKETLIGVSFIILALVGYSYSVIWNEVGLVTYKTMGVMLTLSIMLVIYAHENCVAKSLQCAVCCAAFFAIVMGGVGMSGNEEKMTYRYDVPDGYMYFQNDPVEKMGTGYIDPVLYQDIRVNYEAVKTLDKEQSSLGRLYWFGYYYLYGLKGMGPIEIYPTVVGYGASQEAADIARTNKSIIGNGLRPMRNYYLYNWLLTSGDYIWSSERGQFEYNDGVADPDTAREMNKDVYIWEDISGYKQYASALGSSMDTLENIFSEPDLNIDIDRDQMNAQLRLDHPIDGDEADFLYIECTGMENDIHHVLYNRITGEDEQSEDAPFLMFTKERYNPGKFIVVNWTDEDGNGYCMRCEIGRGKLLIPLGVGEKWLLHDHDSITVSVEQDGIQTEMPEIGDVRFLKLRELA